MPKKINRIGILGDSHLPFQDWEVLEQAAKFFKEHKVEKIISVGDLTDQKGLSRFLKEPDDDSPSLEFQKAVEASIYLHELFPKLDIIPGNHCVRYLKKAKEA